MKFKKRLLILFLLLTFIPSFVYAYSDKVILGGDNIGINVNTKYITIAGFYDVNGKYIGKDAGLLVGDLISKIDDNEVSSINDLVKAINNSKDKYLKITYIRDNKEYDTNLKLVKDKTGVYKTGLYVKDKISGLGTLTYIDPETNIFGCLGHEIADKYNMNKSKITDGSIFYSTVTDITVSKPGVTGEKNAKYDSNIIYGNINSNLESGVYGKYTSDYDNSLLTEVGSKDTVAKGMAKIRTVTDGNKVEEYIINILDIDYENETKNILFEITDRNLLELTGGVVAGMSGSPIIQNNRIIGAVTHVVVNEPTKGYGIFIERMLKDGEK